MLTATERASHLEIRRSVFVAEQGVFERDDRDVHDEEPLTVHVIGYVDGIAAGTVRLYPLPDVSSSLWWGDRLAVLPQYRRYRIGGPLVRYAVRTAALSGGDRMVAHVQLGNVLFFERLGWARVGEPEPFLGIAHQRMTIALV